jgi:hypothetical protein
MSFNFLEQQKLEQFLLELELKKMAQNATPAPTDPAAILEVARKLMNSFTTSTLTADKPDTEVFLKDLTNLDNLLVFLNTNGLRYNGKKISIEATPAEPGMNVYKGAEFSELSDQEKALYANYPEANARYHVYKDGLIHYLQDLKLKGGELGASKNVIDALIAEAQSLLKIHVPQLAARPIEDPMKKKEPGQEPGAAQQTAYTLVDFKPGQQLSPQQLQAVQGIGQTLPLSQDRIDFDRIRNFLETYQKMDPSPSIMPSINNALQAVTNILQYYNQPAQMTNVRVRDIAEAVISNTQGTPQQKAAAPNGYLQYVSQLLSLVGTIIGAYRSKYYTSLPPDMKSEIDEQTAYYNYNRNTISLWQGGLADALKSIQQGAR